MPDQQKQQKTVAIIQARMGSTRLPGKVLADIHGQPMLSRVVKRVSMAKRVDEVVVAVPDTLADRPLIRFCESQNIRCVAGPEQDVLARYVKAARQSNARRVVRITADCPLLDPDVIDDTISVLNGQPNLEYASNFWPSRNFPRGLDTEVLKVETLYRVERLMKAPNLREHVTLGIYQQPHLFQIAKSPADRPETSGFGHLRWTVDTHADLHLVEQIYRYFGDRDFRWRDVIDAYRRFPNWYSINQHIIQKAA